MYDSVEYANYTELAAAIVKRAVDDWRYICRTGTGTELTDDTRIYKLMFGGAASFRELKAFFNSSWCGMLCGGEMQEAIIAKLDAERANAALRGRYRGRTPVTYEHDGEWRTITDWAQIYSMNRRTLYNRILRGMTITEALTSEYNPYKTKKRATNQERKDK